MFISKKTTFLAALFPALMGFLLSSAIPADGVSPQAIAELEKQLEETKEASSEARQRLAVRRVIRDAEKLHEVHKGDPSRFLVLEFLFHAQQQLIALDNDSENRASLMETCRELIKAPDEYAAQRMEADLLISQAELAKQGADSKTRAEALRPFVERYLNTNAANKVMRMAMVMALELGDEGLINDLQKMIQEHFGNDVELIRFQREKLGGDVFGAPFGGKFKRSDGKIARFPMDLLGRSTMLLFWSKEDGGVDYLKGMATDYLGIKDSLHKRLEVISFNLDDLPDAGESIIRGLGVDWQVLHLPGGRDNPVYQAYARADPHRVTISPTGQAALIMQGTGRLRMRDDGSIDHTRMFGSALGKSWSRSHYVAQLSSIFSGDFLVIDPMGSIEPSRPAELLATAKDGKTTPLKREEICVPEDKLVAIDSAFVKPPQRYRLEPEDAAASYSKAAQLCRSAIEEHPEAPDLWIVRNRLIVAEMGLWKINADLRHFEAATEESRVVIESDVPAGGDIVARFCLAREALREPSSNDREILDAFVAENSNNSVATYAAAALLALDVADRSRFNEYRSVILKEYANHPMLWSFTAFLLDRYHKYYLFQVPFSAGRTYGPRESYFMGMGYTAEAQRRVEAELKTLDGKSVRLPDVLSSKWTAVLLAAPWWDEQAPSPEAEVSRHISMAQNRPEDEMEVILLVFSDDAEKVSAALGEKPIDTKVLLVPDGMNNPLVQQLGMASENQHINRALLKKDGSIAGMVSGVTLMSKAGGQVFANILSWHDEHEVSEALDRGDIETAKRIAFTHAPVFDPEATDEKGRKLKSPNYSNAHLRSRARVYMALKEWDKALADAEAVVQNKLNSDGGMSLRTDELDESEALRNTIRDQMNRE